MNFLNELNNNDILIVPSNVKTKALNYISSLNKLLNIKMYTLKELKSLMCFNYGANSIGYLVDKYNYDIDVAKELIENMYFVESRKYNSNKLNKLVSLKNELIENNLLEIDNMFITFNKNKQVYVFGYDYLDKFEKKLLKEFSSVKYISKEQKKDNNSVYKFRTLEEEILFIIESIINLINDGVTLDKIHIANTNDDYKKMILKYFKMFNIPVNLDSSTSLYSSVIGNKLISYLNDHSIEEAVNYLNDEYSFDSDLGSEVYNTILNILNTYNTLDYSKDTINKLIKNDFRSHIISKPNSGGVNITNYKDYYFDDDEYVFFVNFTEGVVPIIHNDESYITDNIKDEVSLDKSYELNVLEKENFLNNINSINNLVISYKESYNGDTYYLSNIADTFNVLEYSFTSNIRYSKEYEEEKLGKLIDDLIKYDNRNDELDLLYSNLSIPYRTFDNGYKKIPKDKIKEKIGKLSLSYTNLNTYYLCAFRFYLDNVLKVNSFTSSFDTQIGELFHYVLSKSYEDNFDFDKEFNYFLKDKEFSSKEQFYISKLEKELRLIVDFLKEFNLNTGLTNSMREKRIVIDNDNYVFKGIIDKIMYKDYDGKTLLSIIDYKTGKASFDIYNSYYGLEMQLPLYLYLISKSGLFKDYEVVGLYLEKILDSEVNITKGKTYKELKYDNLKLTGISTDNILNLERFDPTYQDSQFIRSMKYGQNGFYKYTKVLTDEEFKGLTKIAEQKVNEAVEKIYNSEFDINPKMFDKDNEIKGCKYCKYQDICFRKNEDIKELHKFDDLSFLKEGDENA